MLVHDKNVVLSRFIMTSDLPIIDWLPDSGKIKSVKKNLLVTSAIKFLEMHDFT